jgi:Glycosyl transferases group 1
MLLTASEISSDRAIGSWFCLKAQPKREPQRLACGRSPKWRFSAPECASGNQQFGRITRWKGQDVLIKALADLPGVHGLIVGEALFTAEDRIYREEIRKLATDLGVADRIHFVGFCPDRAAACMKFFRTPLYLTNNVPASRAF